MVWEVQVVMKGSAMRSRPRGSTMRASGGRRHAKERLYALRRRFVAVVDASGVAIKALGNFTPWWSVAKPQRVIAKKRLVKIVTNDNQAIVVRFADEDSALDFAAAIREEWGVEPLMHAAIAEADGESNRRELETMAALFMTSTEFRDRVRQMHSCLEDIWNT